MPQSVIGIINQWEQSNLEIFPPSNIYNVLIGTNLNPSGFKFLVVGSSKMEGNLEITGTLNATINNIKVDDKSDNVNYQMIFINSSGNQIPVFTNNQITFNPSSNTFIVGNINSNLTNSTGYLSSNLVGLIQNNQLQNDSIIIGTTEIELGNSGATTISGIINLTATNITGDLTNSTGYLSSNLVGLIQNNQLQNDSIIIGTTEIDLGNSATTISGIINLTATNITATDFFGDGSNLTNISASSSSITDDTTSNSEFRLVFVDSAGTNKTLKIDTSLDGIKYNPSIGNLKLGEYFQIGASNSNFMGLLGFNRDTSTGAIFNPLYNAYQLHNYNGELHLQAYNNSGGFIGFPLKISGEKVGIGQTPNYPLDTLKTTTSTGYSTATMSAIFQTTAGGLGGKHGVGVGGDYYTGNAFMQSIFNNVGVGFNLLLQPIAGNVGIGAGTPLYPLHITKVPPPNNPSTNAINFLRFGYQFSASSGPASANQIPIGLYCEGSSILTNQGVYTISDRRIKMNIQPLENILNDFCKLEAVKYEYIDKYKMGFGIKYGFIAQQVKKLFPSFVKDNLENYEPSVFKLCIRKKDTFIFNEPHNINKKMMLRFDKENTQFCMIECDVINKYEIKILKCCKADCKIEEDEEVICYGNKINDFHSFDQTELITISVKAIQELKKENDELKKQNEELNNKINLIMEHLNLK